MVSLSLTDLEDRQHTYIIREIKHDVTLCQWE